MFLNIAGTSDEMRRLVGLRGLVRVVSVIGLYGLVGMVTLVGLYWSYVGQT